jgi:VWFA-related protein
MSVRGGALIVCMLLAVPSGTPRAAEATVADTVTLFIAATRSVGGNPVVDLRKDEIEVIVDGKPREIVEFSQGAASVSIALLVDLSASMNQQWNFETVLRALEPALGPDDRMSVAGFGPQVAADLVFTRDPRALEAATRAAWERRLAFAGPSPIWDSANVSIAAIERQDGRRALVLFTDGRATGDLTPFGAVVRHALLANVEVSVMDPWLPHLEGEGRGDPVAAEYDRTGLMPPWGRLRQIAELTGGLVIPLDSQFKPDRLVVDRVARELKAEYEVRFSRGSVDGRPHAIAVRVSRRGVLLRARKVYE